MNPLSRSQDLTFPQKRNQEWMYPMDKAIIAGPVVEGNAVYVASSDGRVYGLDASYGDLKWRSALLGDKLWTTPAVAGDTIYVSNFDGCVCALSTKGFSPAEGVEPFWTFKADAGFVSSPVLYKDTIFVGSFDNNLYAIKVGSSGPMWKFAGDNWFWAAPVVSGGVVYAGCLDGKIYALDAETGDELWEFDTESSIVASPILVDDLLVVACDSGEVYILETDIVVDERLVSDPISIGFSIEGSICVQGGTVYIRAQNDCLYSLDINEGKISWEFPLTIE